MEGPALIVASRSVIPQLRAIWSESLGGAGIIFDVHVFGGECCQDEIDRVMAGARRLHARSVIGAGGGKVLNTARAAADGLQLPVVNCRQLPDRGFQRRAVQRPLGDLCQLGGVPAFFSTRGE